MGVRGLAEHQTSHPERQFQVLTAPDLHAGVVRADVFKVATTDREQTPGHRRTSALDSRTNTHNA